MECSAAPAFANWLPPRYRIDRVLSQGERSTTLEVFDAGLRQAKAVLKVEQLSDETAAPEVEGRFRRFFGVLAAIQSDHLAAPYTFGTFCPESGGIFGYTARPFVNGTPLSGLIVPISEEAAVTVMRQVCHGLDALHANGLVHCDLKPENVIVRHAPGGKVDELSQCVIIDFSYRPEATTRMLTEVTLQYVAPEMLEGHPPDPRADLYALGVMAYRLLAGRFPFAGDSLPEVMRKQRARELPPLASLRPDLARGLCKVVERLLEPNPDNRPVSVQALLALLNEIADPVTGALSAARYRGFVGREAELAACAAALDLDRPSAGVSSLALSGPRGIGVTAFLRELQDRLEAHGVTVLTAIPRAAGGVSLQSQLREAVHALARRPNASSIGAERLRPPETSTDLLDDLFVAAQERRLVLFIDDWRLCDMAEIAFLQRLILQDRAAMEGMAGRTGRCQVVVGDTSGEPAGGAEDALARVIERRIRLEGLTEQDVADLLAGNAIPSRSYAARVHSMTGGAPGAIRAILGHVASGGARTDDALEAALDAASQAASDAREQDVHALRAAPHGRALLALALWGDELELELWQAITAFLEGAACGEAPIDRIERSGRQLVRSRHRDLGEHVARFLSGTDLDQISEGILSATWDVWRSNEPAELIPLLRFVARLGKLPHRCGWRVCRALIVLLDRGRFSDVESIAAALGRCDRVPWWVALFRQAARAGSNAQTASVEDAVPEIGDPTGFFRSWIRARSLLRARYRQEALEMLEVLSSAPLACARPVSLALAEDHALAAAEAGCADKLGRLRRDILGRIRRWLPLVRRRGARSPGAIKARLRACRQVARYQRVRSRTHLLKGRVNRALAACRRERLLNRVDGNLLREASCLNNEGILLIRVHAEPASVAILGRCVRLRERLDDEHGLVIALTNLAAALSVTGNLGGAASVLNRARIVATRNGLSRLRNFSLVNLAVAYNRRGQLRDSRRVLRQVRRLSRHEGDTEAHARGLLNSGRVAVDRWSPTVAERCAALLDRIRESSPECPQDVSGDLVRAELAYRSRDWAHLHTLIARMSGKGPDRSMTAVYEARVAMEAGNEVAREMAFEHTCPAGARLRLALMRRRHGRTRFGSLSRVVSFARRYASAREAVEWILAHCGQPDGDTDAALAIGFKALSWFEFREGHDDLQIELRAQLAAILRRRSRHAEAWRLIEDALLRFRRLERKLRRWPRGAHVLLHLQERLQLALTGSSTGRSTTGQEMSAALYVQAFDVLTDNRRNSIATHDRHGAALLRLGAALSRDGGHGAFLDEVLSIALSVTGAQRAILITGTSQSPKVGRTVLADGAVSGGGAMDMSWAVVSQVLTSGESSLFSDALTAEELASHRSIAVLKLRSLACVPLRAGSHVLGALYLDHHGIAGLITREMLGFLELLAGLIGTTIHVGQVEEDSGKVRRELAETHRHIMRAERNRVAGEIAAGLVHDLKNVLTAISGRAQLLRRVNQDPQVRRSLDAIEKAAGTGTGLVQRLQECARDHSSQSEGPVDLAMTAHEALELLAPRLERNRVSPDVRDASAALAWGAPGEYREMFLNLFVNACDAMPDGGTLSVAFVVYPETRQIEVTVGDTGIGMSAETQARIFEPFFTTKGNSGTGLGLVVVRSVVVRHGGSITVESAPGEGTVFRLVLPGIREQRAS